MKAETLAAFEEAIEGLVSFIAATKPDANQRDKALSGLIKLRNELPNEKEAQ